MVISAKHVQHLIVTTRDFVVDIGDVGGEVGGESIRAHNGTILFVTKFGRLEPGYAVLDIGVPGLLQPLDHTLDVGGNAAFTEPLIVMHAKLSQIVLDVFQNGIQRCIKHHAVLLGTQ